MISVIVALTIGYKIYKNDSSIEGILSIILAIFSMFISMFFYFKTEETSVNFYNASYKFMKEQSNLLGRIEERFGEKFNNLSSEIDNFEHEKHINKENLDKTQDELSDTVEKMFSTIKSEKASTNDIEQYKTQIINQNNKIRDLIKKRDKIINNLSSDTLNLRNIHFGSDIDESGDLQRFLHSLNSDEIKYIVKNKKIDSDNELFEKARIFDICDNKGNIKPKVKILLDIIISSCDLD